MWFLLQLFIAVLLLLCALFGSWYVVWQLILSKFPVFHEILGLRPRLSPTGSSGGAALPTPEAAAALKRRKQKEMGSFVLTRSGEQMAQLKRREGKRQAALAQQAAQGFRAQPQPTSTPITPATPWGAATPAIPAQSAQIGRQNVARQRNPQQQQPQQWGNATPATPALSAHASAVPTSNVSAAAIAAEALHRRRQSSVDSALSAVAAMSAVATYPISVPQFECVSLHFPILFCSRAQGHSEHIS